MLFFSSACYLLLCLYFSSNVYIYIYTAHTTYIMNHRKYKHHVRAITPRLLLLLLLLFCILEASICYGKQMAGLGSSVRSRYFCAKTTSDLTSFGPRQQLYFGYLCLYYAWVRCNAEDFNWVCNTKSIHTHTHTSKQKALWTSFNNNIQILADSNILHTHTYSFSFAFWAKG